MMRAVVLGAAAGGGFPQWNSNALACQRARRLDPAAPPATQAGLALTADDEHWVLFNASPDLRAQIERTPSLHPRSGLRSSPIAAVVLTGSDVDAIAGLLTLRERHPFSIFATRTTLAVLDANPVFDVLDRAVVARHAVGLDEPVPLRSARNAPLGLTVRLFPVPGKVPLYLERPGATPPIVVGEETTGAAISDGRHTLFFIPGCAAMTDDLTARLRGAGLVLFDGTLWTDDEMIRAGTGTKTGRRMGHMSVHGPDGTLAAFRDLDVRRKILIHINNSNPILLRDSAERETARAAGWEVAFDGMEITL
ncbi:MAG: pyrroloquinoline quinone biosynthesis protein PqqB [Acetobacteraceae bacterium]|nr:pyrroloquinoline quinone biosynthesis protein PqqB [Acetobacteraceae bacterium]